MSTKGHALYVDAIAAAGDAINPEDYTDVLESLRRQELGPETPWHKRYVVKFNSRLIRRLDKDLASVFYDMRHARLYPNFRYEGCWDCSFKDLCHAEQYQEDVDSLRRMSYTKSQGYGTTKALELTPQTASEVLCE